MLAKAFGATLMGIEAKVVEVEVDISRGLPAFNLVGLPETTVKESRERVRAALKNSGYELPPRKIVVNLAPADLRKEGSGLDLPIAIGLLAAMGLLQKEGLEETLLVGELSLDGGLKGIRGALSFALAAKGAGFKRLLLPEENAREGALVEGIEVIPLRHLNECVQILNKKLVREPITMHPEELFSQLPEYQEDMAEIKGQEGAKRALEIAAAGGHNVLMIGPPGTGKTMLARRLPSILPPMNLEEALEVTRIWSVAGLLPPGQPLLTQRPFRSPHPSISDAGMIGGGQIPKPGEVSLAHNGVLFLDEFPEFKRNVIEALRSPLEDGKVTLSRASFSVTFPARFILVVAMNPCPCGNLGNPFKECRCSFLEVKNYRSKISGPILDRIDLHVEVPPLTPGELLEDKTVEPSERIRERVTEARKIQLERFKNDGILCNGHMGVRHIKKYCVLTPLAKRTLEEALKKLNFSVRAYHRVLKVARTIADLAGSGIIEENHILEALSYRSLDRQTFPFT